LHAPEEKFRAGQGSQKKNICTPLLGFLTFSKYAREYKYDAIPLSRAELRNADIRYVSDEKFILCISFAPMTHTRLVRWAPINSMLFLK
jgi:hypothetical protein